MSEEKGNLSVSIKASDLPDREIDYEYIIRAIKSHDALLDACKTVVRKDKKSLLGDFAYQGAEGGKHHAEKMGKFYDGYNKCLDEVIAVLKPVIALAEPKGE